MHVCCLLWSKLADSENPEQCCNVIAPFSTNPHPALGAAGVLESVPAVSQPPTE